MLPLAILMHTGTSPGQTFGIALFNEPIRESLGLSHTQLTGAYLIASLCASIPLMWIGKRMDWLGMRLMSMVLVASVGIACLAISQVHGLVGLTFSFFLLRTFGQGGLSLAAGNTLGMWFHKRLGIASGIAGVGMSATVALVPMTFYGLITWLGWRNAYVAIGLVLWGTLLPLLWFFYRNNEGPIGQKQNESQLNEDQASETQPIQTDTFTLKQAIRTPAYWETSASTALIGMISTAIFFNLVPLFELKGFSSIQATAIFPTVAAAMAIMQLKGGVLADRVQLKLLMAIAVTLIGAGVVVIGNANSMMMSHIGGALLGGGQGLMAVTGNTLWPRYYGRQELGAIRSSVWTATVAACSAGPFIMGISFAMTGGYEPSLWLFVTLSVVAVLASIMWGGPPPLPSSSHKDLSYK